MGSQVAFSVAEQAGVRVLEPALAALTTTVAGEAPDLDAVRTAVTAEPDLKLAKAMSDVDHVAGAATTPAGREKPAAALVDLISATGNNSNLILDPDLDSFYVIDVLVVQLTKTLLAAAQAAAPTTWQPRPPGGHAGRARGAAGRCRSRADVRRGDRGGENRGREDEGGH
jgi:hypothetical protein